jgi:hypothetical protein
LDPFPGLPSVSYTTTADQHDNMLHALVLLIHAIFRQMHPDLEKDLGLDIMSIHQQASVVEDEGFTWISRACSCDREASVLVDARTAADLTESAKGRRGPPRGKPKVCMLYAYMGGRLGPPAR